MNAIPALTECFELPHRIRAIFASQGASHDPSVFLKSPLLQGFPTRIAIFRQFSSERGTCPLQTLLDG